MAVSKRKCRQCGEYHEAAAGVKTPAGWFCRQDHAVTFAMEASRKQRDKAIAKQRRDVVMKEREQRKEHKQRVSDVKPLSYWMKRAQAAFNAWIRASKGGQCISCGRYHTGQMHAGHYRTTAAAPEIRFEPDNVWPQCAPCNTHLSGNLVLYRANLIQKIGEARVLWLEGPHEPQRYRKDDYQEIERDFKARLRALTDLRES